MGTRSYICEEKKDGTFRGAYCHWDGYLENNGMILDKYYKTADKVKKLISLGGMSRLSPNIDPDPAKPHTFDAPQDDVCIFYHRDREEPWDRSTKPIDFKDNKELGDPDSWVEYVYVFGLDGVWRWGYPCDIYKGKPLKNLHRSLLYLERKKRKEDTK